MTLMFKQPKIRFKTSHKVRMSTDSVTPGMYIAKLDRPWEETPFPFQGFVIRTWEEVETLRRYSKTVVVDHEKYVDLGMATKKRRTAGTVARKTKGKTRGRPHKQVEEVLPEALETYQASAALIKDIMEDARIGRAIDTPAAKASVSECIDRVIQNPEAILLLSRLRNKDAYTSEHCLSVSILSIALGRSLGLDHKQLEEVGLCGLLHDIGKIATPEHVLLKPDRLTDQEMMVMKKHPTAGRDILMSTDGLRLAALDVAHSHHERLNGSGYPRGLRTDQLSPYTRIVAIADTYDAITSDRVYQQARPPMVAFDMLWKGAGHSWDPHMIAHFVRTLGVYSPGSVVELNTGELGVVIASNPEYRLRPRLLLLPPPDQPLETGKLLDLSQVHTDSLGRPLQIVRMRSPSSVGIELRELMEKGILQDINQLQKVAPHSR